MRRYAVRFLVAILTFGIGVTLSLLLGLFKPQEIKVARTWRMQSGCGKKFRLEKRTFVTIDTESSDPLKLVYLGQTPERRMQFLLENRRDQTISGYTINATETFAENGAVGQSTLLAWGSHNVLLPGEALSITTIPQNAEGLTVRVSSVTFQSGFTWINPREPK